MTYELFSDQVYLNKQGKQLSGSVVKMKVNKLFPVYNSATPSSHQYQIKVSASHQGISIAE